MPDADGAGGGDGARSSDPTAAAAERTGAWVTAEEMEAEGPGAAGGEAEGGRRRRGRREGSEAPEGERKPLEMQDTGITGRVMGEGRGKGCRRFRGAGGWKALVSTWERGMGEPRAIGVSCEASFG